MKVDKLKIEKGDNKTIRESGIEFSIKPYTVLVGENNSGKTNLVTAFLEEWNKKYNIIYFSAINTELEKSEDASTTKKTSQFYKLLAEILKNEKLNLDEDVVGPINKKLSEITDKINKDIGFIKNKETILKVVDTLSEDTVIKNLIPLRILDKYWSGGKEVKPSEIGQGTQRMVIFSLLKYYSEQDVKNKKLNFFIIEEPEIYLHPKLKQEFNKILSDISKKENNQVLVTTHDPYFVEMNIKDQDDKIIIAIKRNSKTGFTEQLDIEPTVLKNISHGEINYLVFGVASESYFLELYQYLKDEKDLTSEEFEKFLFANIKDKTEYKHDSPKTKWKLTYISRLRHNIGHPKDTNTELGNKLDLAIKDLIRIAKI